MAQCRHTSDPRSRLRQGIELPIDPSTAFVSYSREDMEFAVRLAKDLKAKGARVWMDKIDIRPGQRWEAEIETAVDGCSRMLVILSPAAIASPNVLAEASLALDEGKSVIPVLYRDCRIPFRLRPFQYADFRSDYSVGLEELLASLGTEQKALTAPEAIALAAISEALGLDPSPTITTPDAAAKERERQQEALKQQEQAEADRLASLADEEGKQRERAEAAQLAVEEERKQQRAEAQRLARIAEVDRKRLEQAETDPLGEQAKAVRVQREQTEASQLAVQVETKRKADEEVARQAELERARLAAEQERQRLEQEKTRIPVRWQETPAPKFPVWAKGVVAVIATLVAGWLVYLASSGSKPKEPPLEPQKQEARSETSSPATTTQPTSSEQKVPSQGAETKTDVSEPKTSSKSMTSRAPAEVPSRALASPKTADAQAVTNAPHFTDPKTAELYRKAQAGDSGAMVDLAFAYVQGSGVPKDDQQSFYWYRKAAEAGNSFGMRNLGKLYELEKNYQQAINWYRKAAEAGNVQGMAALGWMYHEGTGVPRDYEQAFIWSRKAADAGEPQAMNNLGVMYESGQGVEKDLPQAIASYRKAAQLGNEMAKGNLKRLGQNP